MINVEVFSDEKNWSKKLKKKQIFFNDICNAFPQKYKFSKKKVSFSLMLSNNKKIRKLNKKFRKKDKTTDVLSFPFYEKDILKKLLKKKINFYLGDVVINLNKINGYKNEDFKKNFDKLWIHGFLHLLGYRHKLDKEFIKMSNLEKKFFKSIN